MERTTHEIALIGLFTALISATAGLAIPLGSLPSITLQTVFVFLAGLVLGPKKGALSMMIYLIMGAIGLPVFANYQGGIGIILGQSGGFLIGFVIAAFFIGNMKNIKIINKNFGYLFLTLILGNIIIYMCGSSYIAYITNTTLFAIMSSFTLYFVGDIIKIIVALYVYSRIRKIKTYERE